MVLRELEESKILEKKEFGNAHYYQLADNYLTKELKRFIGLFQIHSVDLVNYMNKLNPDIISIALYGSYALGDLNEKSDIDIIVISPRKIRFDLSEIESRLNVQINVESYTIGQWLKLKKQNNAFYNAVAKNHIILFGGELP